MHKLLVQLDRKLSAPAATTETEAFQKDVVEMAENGDAGIWIQSARSDRAPVLIADGDFVAWSPR